MKTVENGNTVHVHYKGTFPDGEVFDDSRVRGETIQVQVGNGVLIKGFESALLGMTEGQVKTVNLTSDQAYGPVREEAFITAPKSAFPPDFEFEKGMPVTGNSSKGTFQARIISFTEDEVKLDHNHPLAGKDINFEIELVKIDNLENTKSFDSYTVKELRSFAKEKGIKGFSTMKKAELVESLNS
jgi:peptidylprolyl isomerase|tara:strand:- start:214 stop:768 length:555 start_codon:yes stop_codon:yes gene_type:complete